MAEAEVQEEVLTTEPIEVPELAPQDEAPQSYFNEVSDAQRRLGLRHTFLQGAGMMAQLVATVDELPAPTRLQTVARDRAESALKAFLGCTSEA